MLTNAEYHKNRTHLTSSNLKLLLEDPYEFNQRWNLGIYPDEERKSYFQDGSYTHSLLLEPEKIAQEYAIFEGMRKAGKAYTDFVAANPGKEILSMPQKLRAESYAAAVQRLPAALELLKDCTYEQPLLGTVAGINVKCKPDAYSAVKGYIVDVKTTSDPSGIDIFKETVKRYKYDMSAALYAAIAAQVHNKYFDYYWVVISKADLTCEVYKASKETLAEGTSILYTALSRYKSCSASGLWNSDKAEQVINGYEILEI